MGHRQAVIHVKFAGISSDIGEVIVENVWLVGAGRGGVQYTAP